MHTLNRGRSTTDPQTWPQEGVISLSMLGTAVSKKLFSANKTSYSHHHTSIGQKKTANETYTIKNRH